MPPPGYIEVDCPECNGTGSQGNCGWCGGSGQVTNTDPSGPAYLTCIRCNGSGKVEERVD